MPSNGWARLRPVNADLRQVVMVATIVVSAMFIGSGAWSIVNFFRFDTRKDGVNFTIFVYVLIFGVLLLLGELGQPAAIFDFFGFLSSSAGRSFFMFFASTLALSSGWSGDRGRGSNILLIIAGITGVISSFIGLCYGRDHHADFGSNQPAPTYASNPGGPAAGGGGGGGGFSLFGRGKSNNAAAAVHNSPDTVI